MPNRAKARFLVAPAAAIALILPVLPAMANDHEDVEVNCPSSPVLGFDISTTETYGGTRELSASSAEGIVTDLRLAVTQTPDAGTITIMDVEPAGAPGGTATANLVMSDDVSPGTYTATISATTEEGSEGSCVADIEVMPLVHIGDVQGVIEDDQTSFTSPLLGERVAVQGVVTQVTRDGNGNHGFFVQERTESTDDDPRSSDGLFVFNSGFTTLRTEDASPAREELGANWDVTIGDEVVVRGEVGQFFGMTQFSGGSSFVWDLTDSGVDVESTVAIPEGDPPDDAEDSLRYFRRHLGMQLEVPAGSQVVNGRDVFSGTDAEVWAIRGDHPVAQRDEPYARRAFRDAHPLDNNPDTPFDDGNGYRFVLGSFGVKGSTDDPDAVLAPAKTFDTITAANRGGVYLSFGKYTVNVADQLELDTSGADPTDNAPVQPHDPDRELSIAAYNVENLYDFRDSPNSDCDFAGNDGCFADGDSVEPPFDYVPESDADHQARLQRMAEQIRVDLHAPDVILVQETEAQDVCTVSDEWTPETGPGLGADRLDCDLDGVGEDNSQTDGRPDSSLELALVIAEQGGPSYDAAFDLDAGDLRGITTAYLYRTDRVQLSDADPDDPVLGASPQIDYDGDPLPSNADTENPQALNAELPARVAETCTSSGPTECDGMNVFSRGASVAQFRIWRDEIGLSSWTDVYLVNNHQSSGPDRRVLQRIEQATYNAGIAEAILSVNPDARVLIGGDFNVFPRPDDPYGPGEPIQGVGEGPSDQLAALYDSKLSNLHERLVADHPASAYTFGFQGQAQTLDDMWVSPEFDDELADIRSAKINVDWPADAAGEDPAYGRFGVSDHDPGVAQFDAVSFDRVRGLIDLLVDDGRLAARQVRPIQTLLDQAEHQLDAGRPQVANTLLAAAQRTITTFCRVGIVDCDVATALVAEMGQLTVDT